MFGIYLLGMFTRRGNATGALLGGILGTATGIFIAFFFKDANGNDRISFLWPTVFGLPDHLRRWIFDFAADAVERLRSGQRGSIGST